MSDPVLLNNVDHHDLRVITRRGAQWGDAVNEVTVFAPEFEVLSREYPIIFRRDDEGAFRTTVLLGLDPNENLFLDGDRWNARAMPALMARGPFSIGVPPDGEAGEPMIHIDLADPRVGRDEGQPVFREHGGSTPYLDQVAAMLRNIYAGSQIATAMIAAFGEAGLFEEMTLELDSGTGRKYRVPGVWTLSAERFSTLDGVSLARLNAADFLRCAVWIMSSLGNVSALLDRKLARGG